MESSSARTESAKRRLLVKLAQAALCSFISTDSIHNEVSYDSSME